MTVLLGSCKESMTWSRVSMKTERTGVVASNASNVAQAMGTITDSIYTAPNGKVFAKCAKRSRRAH